ncbi:TonB-dependent receptor [Novosphingobium sp. JCM 18896]|uniref:TonB-dependent receptor n=1 Tax=Novosphingobium sp. JCM 18896 TaxID=2989731 RepID=UPI002221BE19|nr:TonB-dependent receptor [Novosphingobium sp. JCM 18896]MCW1430975.1 TonB-dependent receptor [Novosphingobium sp. JCM 18896]
MRKLIVAGLMAGVSVPFAPAYAQDSADTNASGDEIIVTARRREESLSKVPIAITAISGADLAKRAINNENDLQSAVPGLVIRQNGGVHSFNYSIRGQSVDTFTNSPPSVLPYVNEVQIVTHNASTFYDMGGIQVLKGPQGTLFGRNATGGAVLYQTAKPTDEFGGYVQGRYGSYDARNVQGAVNLPLGEIGALRVAGSWTGGGAFVRDYFTGEKYGDLDQKSVRASLKLTPTAGLTNTTVFQYTDEDGTNTPYQLWSVNPVNCANPANGTAAYCLLNPATSPGLVAYLATHPAVFQGGLNAAVALQRQLGPWESLASYPPYHKASNTYVINTTEFELSSDLTLKNIFGYNRAKSDDGYDYDGSPYHFFETQGTLTANEVKVVPTNGFRLNTRQISDELQLQGKAIDGRLDYVVGFYYLNQRDRIVSNLTFGQPIFAAPFAYTAQISTESVAGFAQASFKVTDQFSLTGGFRYTHDKTEIFQLPGSAFLPFFPGTEKTSASKPSWTVSLDYQVTPELLVYVAHRGSWRAGGYNYSVTPLNVTAASGGNLFLPETTQDIEGGIKYSGNSLGVPVTFNADVFNQWVKNIQRSAYILTANGVSLLTVNVPKAQITGFEFDFSVRPTEYLQFGASGNYTNARYTSNAVSILGSTINYGPFADVPKWSGTVFAEVGVPLGDAGKLTLRGDAYGQTKMNFSNVGDTVNPNTTLPGYALFNARLTWSEIMGSKLSASAFVRNLGNRRYWSGGNAASNGGNTNVVNPGLPRMWGGELRYEF